MSEQPTPEASERGDSLKKRVRVEFDAVLVSWNDDYVGTATVYPIDKSGRVYDPQSGVPIPLNVLQQSVSLIEKYEGEKRPARDDIYSDEDDQIDACAGVIMKRWGIEDTDESGYDSERGT